MMKLFTRIACALLVVIMCIPALAGCRFNNEPEGTQPSSDVMDSGSEGGTEEILPDLDLKGEEINILFRDDNAREWSHTEKVGTTTAVNDALYKRNTAVQSKYDVKLLYKSTKGSWAYREELLHEIATLTQAGGDGYEMVSGTLSVVQQLAVKQLTMNINSLPYVDLTEEWWSEDFAEGANVNGKIFVAIGDLNHSIYEGLEVMFVNEDMLEVYLPDVDIYKIVEDGDWTLELLERYAKTVGFDPENPVYGLLLNGHAVRNMTAAFEIEMAVKNKDTGIYSFPNEPPARTTNVFLKIKELCWTPGNGVYYGSPTGADVTASTPMFVQSQGMFYAQRLKEAESIADSTFDFGIVPFPMYDDNQLEYSTSVQDNITATAVLYTVADREATGAVLEALAYYGYEYVRPAYYESVLKKRLLGRPELADMLDDIRSGMTVRFEMAYNWPLGYPYSFGSNLIGNTEVVSYWVESASLWNSGLDTIYDALR